MKRVHFSLVEKHQGMSDVDLALGHGNRFDVRGAEGIRNLCLAGKGVEHDMNVVGLVDDLFSIMVLAAVLQVFHGLWVSCGRGSGGVDGGGSDGDGSDAAVAGRQRQRHSGGGDDGSGSDGRESPVHS